MATNRRLWLRASLIVLLLLAGAAYLLRDLTTRSFPQQSGEILVEGLNRPVEILRSPQGVPHIYAQNEGDLFFAQGYVHAQDRFYQMDFFRHVGRGRLAEMFGGSQLETDTFLQTLGWERIAQAEYDQIDPATRQILQAYSRGVNAYLAGRRPGQISLEYVILGILSPSYQIKPWQPVDTLTWAKSMAWDLGGNMDDEIDRAILLTQENPEVVAALYPDYPSDHPIITGTPRSQRPAEGWWAMFDYDQYRLTRRLQGRLNAMSLLQNASLDGIGSNNWVLAAERSASGSPLLANDTHLGIQMPSIWYEMALHCQPVTEDCPLQAAGFSFAGAPGVIIGHNQRIAWGVTNAGPDVQDLFIEQLDPGKPDQYLFEDEWRPMEVEQVQLEVARQEPVSLTVRRTHHGPLITDSYGPLDDPRLERSMPLTDHYGFALRWTALDRSTLVSAIVKLNRASNWQEFRQALSDWDVPAQNFVYADVDGNIGYQLPGRIPLRRSGQGWLAQPGWTGEYEWQGTIPYADLPNLFNPAEGFIVTANNAIVGQDFPFFIDKSWDYGYRANRIQQLIATDSAFTLEKFMEIQGDNLHPMANVLIPYLRDIEFDGDELAYWAERLAAWDGQNDSNSAEAAVFNALWRELVDYVFTQEFGQAPVPTSSRAFVVVTNLLEQPNHNWWDLDHSSKIENRDIILQRSLEDALIALHQQLGDDVETWRWGDLHSATFRNQSLGKSGLAPIEALFNRGPYPTSGGSSIVNATGWKAEEGFELTSLPSQRLLLDLSDWDRAQTIHTTGQSGHAFHPNYDDLIDPWRRIQYHALPWTRQAVEGQANQRLLLSPNQ